MTDLILKKSVSLPRNLTSDEEFIESSDTKGNTGALVHFSHFIVHF